MLDSSEYIASFLKWLDQPGKNPWEIISEITHLIEDIIPTLDEDFVIDGSVAIHKTAVVEPNVVLKPPVIVGKNCFIGANSYLRNGVYLTENVKIGAGCEIKSAVLFENSAIAHFNFIGDSLIGSNVNFEAGSVTANHYNERENKAIFVLINSEPIDTKVTKFGSLVGDNSKIGANAVLSPGTLLAKGSIVKRLELVEQVKE
ncbi:DapH/DapD/GlmU-related protein [Telluribacter humicola]|uniref:DapH/DapD/GlmU-related protein n=1 Tax=Telluribacter humicola TaxID=1720261 RepID=UPI001A971E9E|nr:DapH/DapD/GlmU-related protein [Telluribacter humicola]